MDKATKVAVEKYPHCTFDGEIGDSLRAACAVGYMRAEQDLALTWEDVAVLITIYEQEVEAGNISRYEDEGVPSLQEASEIILRKFNKIRKK